VFFVDLQDLQLPKQSRISVKLVRKTTAEDLTHTCNVDSIRRTSKQYVEDNIIPRIVKDPDQVGDPKLVDDPFLRRSPECPPGCIEQESRYTHDAKQDQERDEIPVPRSDIPRAAGVLRHPDYDRSHYCSDGKAGINSTKPRNALAVDVDVETSVEGTIKKRFGLLSDLIFIVWYDSSATEERSAREGESWGEYRNRF
jgi:hypothetical protein